MSDNIKAKNFWSKIKLFQSKIGKLLGFHDFPENGRENWKNIHKMSSVYLVWSLHMPKVIFKHSH